MSDIDLGELSDRELLLLTANHVNELCGHVQSQNGRIGKLEQWRDKAIGVLLVLGIVVPALVSWVVGKL